MVQARVLIAIFTVRAPTHFLSKLRGKERVPLLFPPQLRHNSTTYTNTIILTLTSTHSYTYSYTNSYTKYPNFQYQLCKENYFLTFTLNCYEFKPFTPLRPRFLPPPPLTTLLNWLNSRIPSHLEKYLEKYLEIIIQFRHGGSRICPVLRNGCRSEQVLPTIPSSHSNQTR